MNITSREELLPLTPQTYYILLALAKKRMAGYEIMEQAQADARGAVQFKSGLIYPALKKLLVMGLIRELENDGWPNPGKPRRIYELTEVGRAVLGQETDRLEGAVKVARERLKRAEGVEEVDFSD